MPALCHALLAPNAAPCPTPQLPAPPRPAACPSKLSNPAEQKMMLKERASGMYRLSAFYLARTASDIPSDLSIPSLFIAIVCEWMRRRGVMLPCWFE